MFGRAGYYMLTLLACLSISATAIAQQPEPGKIDPAQIKPGGEIEMIVPGAGNSARSSGASPVLMKVLFPDNYSPDTPHPVFAYLGGGRGTGNSQRVYDALDHKDFICVGVDYSSDGDMYRSGIRNATAAVTILAAATKIDMQSVFLGGTSSGAYATTGSIDEGTSAPYAGFVILMGGMPMPPAKLGRKPILWVAGEKDTEKASAGMPRVEAAKQGHQALAQAGCDSTLIVQPGVGHGTNWRSLKPELQKWIYSRLPEMQRVKALEQQLAKAKSEPAKLKLYQQIAGSWVDLPIVAEAEQAVEAAAANEASDPPAVGGDEPAEEAIRIWTDSTGKHTIEARFVQYKASKVHLEKPSGEPMVLPMSKLSRDDQAYVRRLLRSRRGQ